jgi:hypothetical protein
MKDERLRHPTPDNGISFELFTTMQMHLPEQVHLRGWADERDMEKDERRCRSLGR